MIRLLLIEDELVVRQGLHMLFATEADITVIGEAMDSATAAEQVKILCPDVVLIDGDIRSLQGAAIVKALQALCQKVPVIVLSLHDDALIRARAEDAGVAAFVAKSLPVDTLLTAIRQVVH